MQTSILAGAKMPNRRRVTHDARTIARDIPGISDILFPHLTPGLVVHLNKGIHRCAGIEPVPEDLVKASTLTRAMLFEVAFARAEQIVQSGTTVDWNKCLKVAISRQRRHFDASFPAGLEEVDTEIADWVGRNLVNIINDVRRKSGGQDVTFSPFIPGYGWIASSEGDIGIGTKLIEVKCTNKKFGSADYRQILMYWLLSYAASIEYDAMEWSTGILLNPRLNHLVKFSFDDIVDLVASGRTKVELVEIFSVLVGDSGLRAMADLEL